MKTVITGVRVLVQNNVVQKLTADIKEK